MISMLHKSSFGGAVMVCTTMLSANPVQALTPLTVATSAAGVSSRTSGAISDSGDFCTSGPPCGSFAASADAGGAGGGSVHATVTLSGVPLIGSNQDFFGTAASAKVLYGIELTGPAGVWVPLDVSSYLSSSGSSSAEASLVIDSQIYGQAYVKDCFNGACYDSSPLFDSQSVTGGGSSGPAYLLSDKEYIVTLSASVYAQQDDTADAFVDPTFSVDDPAFAGKFQLLGLPAVPEPTSWALMLTGFGMTGQMLRSRWQKVRVAYG